MQEPLTRLSVVVLVLVSGKCDCVNDLFSKNAGRGNKGMYHRAGGQVNRGFEGGQSNLAKRFPKRGMKSNKFNIKQRHDQLNLGQLAYYI